MTAKVILVLLIAVVLLSLSCRQSPQSPPPDMVIVRVYRDAESDFRRELDYKLYNFTNQRPRISSGRWIYVATVEPYDYRNELGGKVAIIKPQMVVLDAPADAALIRGMEFDLQRAKNVCDMNKQCPAFIPSWVSGDELEAAKKLLDAIAAK